MHLSWGSALLLTHPNPTPASLTLPKGRRPKLLFLATEDWYFWSDRLPFARALRDAGCEIIVAARVQAHGERIRGEEFALHPLGWRRRGDGFFGAVRAMREIIRLYRAERPDIVNHLALKPVVFGSLARRLSFRRNEAISIDWIMGLGSGFAGPTLIARLLGLGLRVAMAGARGRVVVQNPDDGAVLARLGIDHRRIVLIRGSGVDAEWFAPLSDPAADTVTVALVSRMLRDKGVLD